MKSDNKYMRPLRALLTLSCTACLLLGLAACESNEDIPTFPEPGSNLFQALQQSPGTTTMEEAIEAADLEATFTGAGPITVFAVLDRGFDDIDVDSLLAVPEDLSNILQYHVVQGAVTRDQLTDGATLTTLTGDPLFINVNGREVLVNGATVTLTNDRGIEVTNGIIYPINRLLFPDLALQAMYREDLSTLEAVLIEADLLDDVQGATDVTVFAPTDEVFDDLGENNVDALLADPALLSKVLRYHVVPGQKINVWDLAEGVITPTTLTGEQLQVAADVDTVSVGVENRFSVTMDVNGVPVSNANFITPNGVLHLLDGILLQNLNLFERIFLTPATDSLGEFLELANLDASLIGPGPFTVAAGTNAAFEGIDTEELTGNLPLLTRILEGNIIDQEILEDDITGPMVFTTRAGTELRFDVDAEGDILINDIPVTEIIETPAGNIFLVDEVLGQENLSLYERLTLMPRTTAVEAAAEEAGLADLLANEGPFTIFAPRDQADNIDELLDRIEAGDASALQEILEYHIVSGEIEADAISDAQRVQTRQGGELTFLLEGDEILVVGENNRGRIVTADIPAANGIIHLIDTVLLPTEGVLNLP